ncbi:MAG: hypothetical protein DMG97_39640 [Acidobacteria bacterium]|nr:MAG: hypothetical protein DMG97_39640 [Acidobacteriota bacterium]
MRRDKFAKLPIKADGAHNIELDVEYLDPRYRLELSSVSPATETGLISLFRLVPNNPSLPGFAARWDDRQQTIDVDPDPLACIDHDSWRYEKDGYSGHHTDRFTVDPRVYQIDLNTPDGLVFRALSRLNIQIGVRLEDGFGVTAGAACDAVVTNTRS